MQIISVKNLSKTYKTHERGEGFLNAIKSLVKRNYKYKKALRDVSIEIDEGEIVGLIGPNGAGKSTLVKALSGILYPSKGNVEVMNFVPWKDRVRYVKNIGVVFGQKSQLWWDLPAIDTFYLHKELYDIKEKDFNKRLKQMIELLDVEDIVKIPVRDLSLGERMKCEIIASLLHMPKVVFLDEPTIGVDIISKNKLREFIKKLNKENKITFIITTHDMQDIEKLCERIIIINHGELVYDGLLKEIKSKFLKTKIIDVKFDEEIKDFNFKGCKILDKKTYEFRIEINTKKQSINNVVNYLVNKYKFEDLVISDPSIEEVIEEIYKYW